MEKQLDKFQKMINQIFILELFIITMMEKEKQQGKFDSFIGTTKPGDLLLRKFQINQIPCRSIGKRTWLPTRR